MTYKQNERDKQAPKSGKRENDSNKLGDKPVTQLNQSKRTRTSRSDDESNIGGNNQAQSRRGGVGGLQH